MSQPTCRLSLLVFGIGIFAIGGPLSAQGWPKSVQDRYEKHKSEVLCKFTDKHGLVVELRDGKPDGLGDAAWRTGLAATCFAIEKDDANTQKYLTALKDKCWRDGKPIRHPDSKESGEKAYSRDQFIPQMTACFFAHEYGNDDTKKLAKELFQKFVDRALADDWRLNEGEAATIDEGNRFAFYETADRLGLVPKGKDGTPSSPKLNKASGRTPRLKFVAALKAKSVELANPDVAKALTGEKTFQYYGVHLTFLEAVVVCKCRPQTDDLWPLVKDLAKHAGKQNTAPFQWLAGEFDRPRELVKDWPKEWDKVDYVWQRSKFQQEDAAKNPSDGAEYPRLDYMLLRRLFDVEMDRKK